MNKDIIIHVIAPGDTLYSLARRYNTTVDIIMDANPYLDPNRLVVGDQIIIYRRPNIPSNAITERELELMDNMAALFDNNVILERQSIVSVVNNLNDIDVINERMLRNVIEIGNLFRRYYGSEIADRITNLFRNHLLIGSKFIDATKKGDNANAETYNREWLQNADNIAALFNEINPFFQEDEVRQFMYGHIDRIKRILSNRLASNYAAEMDAFDEAREQVIMMSDYFTNGIIEQFPNQFL